jgi:hypothetical protein
VFTLLAIFRFKELKPEDIPAARTEVIRYFAMLLLILVTQEAALLLIFTELVEGKTVYLIGDPVIKLVRYVLIGIIYYMFSIEYTSIC